MVDTYNPKVQTLYRSEIEVSTYHASDSSVVEGQASDVANSNDCEHQAKTRHPLDHGTHYTSVYFMSEIHADVKAAAEEFLSWCRFRDDVIIKEC